MTRSLRTFWLAALSTACIVCCGNNAPTPGPTDVGATSSATSGVGSGGAPGKASYVPYTPNLRTTGEIAWGQHGQKLAHPDVQFEVCGEHFPPGSDVREEIARAVAWYNGIGATALKLALSEGAHRDVEALYEPAPMTSRFDYVDVGAAGYAGQPCHAKASDTTCSSWTMNTCTFWGMGGWGNSGQQGRQQFTIGANSSCYGHFNKATSDDHPMAHGVAHELGHGFGMVHAESWPDGDRGLVSTMQGKLPMLSAYDIAFVRAKYPAPGADEVVDVAVSPVSRLATANGFTKCYFGDFDGENGVAAEELYRDTESGELRDCGSNERPRIAATWFNLGTVSSPALEAVLSLRSRDGGATLPLAAFTTSPMPRESQDHWASSIAVPNSLVADVPNGARLEFAFELDVDETLAERDETNNAITAPVTFVGEASNCSAKQAPACASLIK